MNRKLALIIFTLSIPFSARSQVTETLNVTDTKGLKQGHWIKKDHLNRIVYDGYFRDDKPAGTFRRFYDDGKIQSVLVFSQDGLTAEAVFYHRGGEIASRGKYVNQLKEGKWQYFSSKAEGYMIGEEEYLNNRKNGLSVRYYPDGSPMEKLTYRNDVKHGEWIQYYSGKKICISAVYEEGKLNGKYTVYYENGNPEFAGNYMNDARNGEWIKYNPDGTVKSTIRYVKGIAMNPELYIKETRYLDSLEKNMGKIPDPEKTGTIWD